MGSASASSGFSSAVLLRLAHPVQRELPFIVHAIGRVRLEAAVKRRVVASDGAVDPGQVVDEIAPDDREEAGDAAHVRPAQEKATTDILDPRIARGCRVGQIVLGQILGVLAGSPHESPGQLPELPVPQPDLAFVDLQFSWNVVVELVHVA